jgi:hypothetical protein
MALRVSIHCSLEIISEKIESNELNEFGIIKINSFFSDSLNGK